MHMERIKLQHIICVICINIVSLSFNMTTIDILRLETKQEGPPILHGRNPEELPSRQLDNFQENERIFAAFTGPDSGLTAVNLQQRHLSINDSDIDYIDMLDQNEQYKSGEFKIVTLMKYIFVFISF